MFEQGFHPELGSIIFLFERGLGVCYLIAFTVIVRQYLPLYGSEGVIPVSQREASPEGASRLSVFTVVATDRVLVTAGYVGLFGSIAVLLGIPGRIGPWASLGVFILLWVLAVSFYNTSAVFLDFTADWTLLLEMGFLGILLMVANESLWGFVVLLLRWSLFRLMFGSGIAKIRGDDDWQDFTALKRFFETMPFPNRTSWYLHQLPSQILAAASLLVLLIELLVPWFYFFPQPWVMIAGIITILFQLVVFISGNLASINIQTAVLALVTLDSELVSRYVQVPEGTTTQIGGPDAIFWLLGIGVVLASFHPVRKMIRSPSGFSRYPNLPIVNAFSLYHTIAPTRYEIQIEGTMDEPEDPDVRWEAYRLRTTPHNETTPPSHIAPYNRLFEFRLQTVSGRSPPDWFQTFLRRLLEGESQAHRLLQEDAFPTEPPMYVRAVRYRYRFTTWEERRRTGCWWIRERHSIYHPPVSLEELSEPDGCSEDTPDVFRL